MKTSIIAASYDLNFSITPIISDLSNSKFEAKQSLGSAQANRIVTTEDSKFAICTNPSILIYDPKSLNSRSIVYQGHQTNVTDVVFNGNTFYSCSEDRTCKIWSRSSPRPTGTISTSSSLNSINLTPCKNYLITANEKGQVEMFDIRNAEKVNSIKISTVPIRSLALTQDGKKFVAVTHNGLGHIYSILDNNFEKISEFEAHPGAIPLRVVISPDSNSFVTTGSDSIAKLWDINNNQLKDVFKNQNMTKYLWDAAFTSDSKMLITGGTDKFIRVWDISTKEILATFDWHAKGITCLSIINY